MLKRFLSRYAVLFFMVLIVSENSSGQISTFSFTPGQGCAPLMVQFSDFSQNAVSYYWDFGNGNSSTLPDPSNVYSTPGTYTITLTVTGPGGMSSSSTQFLNVLAKPVADFNVLQTSACQNYGVFNFLNLSNQFDSCIWDFGDGTISTDLHPSHIYNVAGKFSVTLVVFNRQNGCSDIKFSNNLITVLPTPSGNIILQDTVSCDPGHLFSFAANISNAVSWYWDFGDGINANYVPVQHAYNDTGFFDVSLYLTSNDGCMDTLIAPDRIHIKWNPVPLISLNSDTGCVPHNLLFHTANIPNTTYHWELGNGSTASRPVFWYIYKNSGNYAVNLTVNYSNGCQNTAEFDSVVVLPSPILSFDILTIQGCAPLHVQFQNTSNGLHSWRWDFGDGDSSNQHSPSHLYLSKGEFTPSLTATSSNGCSSTFSSPEFVKVFKPTAEFDMDVVSGCPPLAINFSNLSVDAVNYLWDFKDGNFSSDVDPGHVFSTSGQYSVSLTVEDENGCSDSMILPSPVNVSDMAVNYQVPPVINGCAPYNFSFSDASGAFALLWDFGDGVTSVSHNPTHTYTAPGTYTVSLSTQLDPSGCLQHIPVFQEIHLEASSPGFVYSVSPCPPYEVYFTDTSVNSIAWNWSFGDGTSSNLQSPSHTYFSPGNYDIVFNTVTAGGCSSSVQITNGVVINGMGASPYLESNDTFPPYEVNFFANSIEATWWIWSFGDGDTSFLENPVHVYQQPGPYPVSLTVGNDSCTATYDFPAVMLGDSVFKSTVNSNTGSIALSAQRHCAPYSVFFNSPVVDASAYLWDFGDGAYSNLPSTEHVYLDSGMFIPRLMVTDLQGIVDTLYFNDTIFISKAHVDFNVSTENLCSGIAVQVSTYSGAVSCQWDFNNGVIVNAPVASIVYPDINATYLISLRVVDSFNCSSHILKSLTVAPSNPIQISSLRACTGDSLIFDFGNLNYASWLWDFGDGHFSLSKHPYHVYAQGGIYQVALQVIDSSGCMQTFQFPGFVEIIQPRADFSIKTSAFCPQGQLAAFLTNKSSSSTSWHWDFGDSTSSNVYEPIHVFYNPGSYNISLIASKAGCHDTLMIDSAVYRADLIPDFNFNVDHECLPASVSFFDSSKDAVSWLWEFGDGDTSSLKNPSHIYTEIPVDSITLTVKSSSGCVRTIRKPAPDLTKADFYISALQGCVPFTVQFTDSSSNAISWFWDFGDSHFSGNKDPGHTYMVDGFYDLMLVVTGPSGCTDTVSLDSLVEVNTPMAGFVIPDTAGCPPLLMDLTDSSENAVKWFWNLGNGSSSSNREPSVIYSNPGFYGVSLTVQNKFGCQDSLFLDSIIHVLGSTVSFTVSDDTGCAPFQVFFQNNSSGAVSWIWNFGDGHIDSAEFAIHQYADTGSFTPSLLAIDSSGCESIYTIPGDIVVGRKPQLLFSMSDVTGCLPLTVSISDGGTSADSLFWNMGDGNYINGPLSNYTYQVAGDYNVVIYGINELDCIDSLVFTDTIKAYPVPEVDFSAGIISGCLPLDVDFINLTASQSQSQYSWDFGDNTISNDEAPSHVYTSPGVYAVSLMVINGGVCYDSLVKQSYIHVLDSSAFPPTNLIRATVFNDDRVLLQWRADTLMQPDYYVIYRFDTTMNDFDSLSSVYLSNGSLPFIYSFYDSLVDVSGYSYEYKISSVNSCGNSSSVIETDEHGTILLSAAPGLHQVYLRWNPYTGCSVGGYEVYRSDQSDGNFILLGTLDDTVTTFLDNTAFCSLDYRYFIKAVGLCGDWNLSSFSNTASAHPSSLANTQSVDIIRATVVSDGFNLVEWSPPAILPGLVTSYEISRTSDGSNYTFLATVPANSIDYEDREVFVDFQSYIYKVNVLNICDVATLNGYRGSSILLENTTLISGNSLKWNDYLEWESGVEYYVVEKLNDAGIWQEVGRTVPTVTEWEVK